MRPEATDDAEAEVLARLRRWRDDPAAFVFENWGIDADAWQQEVFALFANPAVERIAMKACKGPGKTWVLAVLVLNFLCTRPECKIVCTSITGDNLRGNLWAELAMWLGRSEFLRSRFTWSATAIRSVEKPHSWFAEARTWPRTGDREKQAAALAGTHGDYVLYVVDESSEVPQAVMATAEAALSTGIETRLIQAGNPTRRDGPLARACMEDREYWRVVTVTGDPDDPRRSPRVKIEWARQEIAKYGRDNPWVQVNVFGEFPAASLNTLLGPDEVEAAMSRQIRPDAWEWAQKRLGVDVARFGDDRSVIFPRQGLMSFRPVVLRNAPTTDIAARVAQAIHKWGAEVTFVDDTGHWGHGVIDNLQTAGIPAIPVIYHAKAIDPRYANRRCEMWMLLADWVKGGGCLPRLDGLIGELTTPTYSFANGVFLLESKDQIKQRLGRSPDLADALAQTFCLPDQPGDLMQKLSPRSQVRGDFDPYALDTFDPFGDDR